MNRYQLALLGLFVFFLAYVLEAVWHGRVAMKLRENVTDRLHNPWYKRWAPIIAHKAVILVLIYVFYKIAQEYVKYL